MRFSLCTEIVAAEGGGCKPRPALPQFLQAGNVGRMRVLHVASSIDATSGGTATVVQQLAPAQQRAGLAVRVIATVRTGEDPVGPFEVLRNQSVVATAVGPTRGPLRTHPELATAVAGEIAQSDVVHIHGLWEEIQYRAGVLARRAGKPVVWQPHGMLDPWSLAQSRWKKRAMLLWRVRGALNGSAALTFTTESERRLVAPLNLKPRAIVEPLGIDSAEFARLPGGGELRAKFPQIGERRIVLFLSRVHHKKGLDLLIPAFARAATANEVLVLAGPVAEGFQPQLDELIAANKLQGRVVFTGMLYGRDRLAAYADAALFVLPSYQENFGIVVAEAMAAGCPVIVSDQVNLCTDLIAADAGLVVPTEIAPLAEAMKRRLTATEEIPAVIARARELVRERYNWEKIAQRWALHYASL